jgi:hypothetical protein
LVKKEKCVHRKQLKTKSEVNPVPGVEWDDVGGIEWDDLDWPITLDNKFIINFKYANMFKNVQVWHRN